MKLPRSSRRPRALVINKFYPPFVGGVEKVAADIVSELSDKFDFHVLACQSRGRRSVEQQGNVTVERCGSWGTARSMPVSFEFLRRYQQLAPQFDLIHFHEPFPLGTLAGCLFGFSRAVITFHSEVSRQRILKHAYLPMLDRLLKRSNAIMPTSQRLGEHANALRPYSTKIRPVPLGIEDSGLLSAANQKAKVAAIRNRFGTECLFLTVGRSVSYKGFEVLIDALAILEQGQLVIAGDGPLLASLKRRAVERGVANRIYFAGKLTEEELALYFQACDVFVLPSVLPTEAFGLVQLQAMASGKPVINTDLPTGVPYVSLNEVTGLTVPAGHVESLARAMRRLQNSSEERAKLGRNAKSRFRKHFRRSQMGDNVLAVYQEVLSDLFDETALQRNLSRLAA